MNIVVTEKISLVVFEKLHAGDLFRYSGDLYMKTEGCNYPAVSLDDGRGHEFDKTAVVEAFNNYKMEVTVL